MPSDVLFKLMNTGHRVILKATGGRLGWGAYGMPVIELTTTGRKSGEPRTVMLTSPVHDDGTYVLVGSRGGDDTTPAWVHNIRANPAVEVSTRGAAEVPMTGRVAEGEERDALWERIAREFPHYAGYQEKTERVLPLVVLEPLRTQP